MNAPMDTSAVTLAETAKEANAARKDAVGQLTAMGLSTRAIAKRLGLSHVTVFRYQQELGVTERTVTGIDGKLHPVGGAKPVVSLDEMKAKPNTLYRFFNTDGDLLYVGLTSNPGARFKQHSSDKEWWEQVTGSTMEHFDTKSDLVRAEAIAINVEKPRYNLAIPPMPLPQRSCDFCGDLYWPKPEPYVFKLMFSYCPADFCRRQYRAARQIRRRIETTRRNNHANRRKTK